jgi:hypothetical protein
MAREKETPEQLRKRIGHIGVLGEVEKKEVGTKVAEGRKRRDEAEAWVENTYGSFKATKTPTSTTIVLHPAKVENPNIAMAREKAEKMEKASTKELQQKQKEKKAVAMRDKD